ncbi:AEC family transporter [Coriobacteriia bacterium Es71-Z0120]|uniref:AEC family transporter n=1 Tax=Parvivirga hydrogeniphila TaxID=2939460 RepID=UPI0022609477|nr:AEC family transporter [Parvivirga hydrogeniphila]MCL4078798.1 AEC family transporter [Parvivirga hydrogeniphila]
MPLGELLGVIATILGYVAIGVALRVTGVLKPEDAKPLNAVLLNVGLPALVFSSVHGAKIERSLALVPALAWVVALVGLAAALLLARVLKLPPAAAGAFVLAAVFGNTGYIGYPVAHALLGEPGLVRAIFSDIFGNTLAMIAVGALVAARIARHEADVRPLKEIVTFPPFVALALALATRGVDVPIAFMDWLGALGRIVVPLIMISVGLSLRPRKLKDQAGVVAAVAAVKLVVLPLVGLLAARLILRDEASARVVVLEASVPTMMMAVIMGHRFDLDTDLIASAVLVTTVVSVVAIPVWQMLV